MTQTANPNGTRDNGIDTSGCTKARIDLCLDEGVDTFDTTSYGFWTVSGKICRIRFEGPTDPATHWGHKVRLVASRIAGGGVGTFLLDVELRQATTLISDLGTITLVGGYSTFTLDVPIADVANITDYNELEAWMTTTAVIVSGSPQGRLTAVDFQCPDVGGMEASIALASTAAGTLLGAGAIGASLTLLSTATGTSLGAGALAASVPTISAATGTAGGVGALASAIVAGTSAMPPSMLLGAGALGATVPLVSGVTATPQGAAAIAATIRVESHMAAHHDGALPRKLQLTLPHEAFANPLIWTLMLPDFAPIAYLRVENKTDVRIEGRFGSSGPREFFVEQGDFREWWLQEHQLRGPIYVRGSGVDPSSGNVKAEIHYQ